STLQVSTAPAGDVEKGDTAHVNAVDSNKIQTTHSEGATRATSAMSKASRWAVALANATNNNNNDAGTTSPGTGTEKKPIVDDSNRISDMDKDFADNPGGSRRTELVCKKSEH